MQIRQVLITAAVWGMGSAAYAETRSESWADRNFVPCEGLGVTATGRISATVEFSSVDGGIRVTQLHLHTEYQHPHDPTATLTFKKPDGLSGEVRLQKPWFDTIGPDDGSKDLYLPQLNGGAGASAQTPFDIASGSPIKISVTTLFPQQGGNCLSSFSDTLSLP
jgi:hypothetical protein